MSKIITSPVKRYPGTVRLSDPLTYPQTFAVEDAISAAKEVKDGATQDRLRYILLDGVLPCVEEWHLEGVPTYPTRDTFPNTPKLAAAQLVNWLVGEIMALYQDAETPIPNA